MGTRKTKKQNRGKVRQDKHTTTEVYMDVDSCVTKTHKAYGFQGIDLSCGEPVIFWVPKSQCAEVSNNGKQYVVIPKWIIDSRMENALVIIPFTL